VAHQPGDHSAIEQVLLDDLVNVFDLDVLVEDSVRVHEYDRPDGARAQAACLDDSGLPVDAQILELFGERSADLESAGRDAPTSGADEHVISDVIHIRSFDIRWWGAYDDLIRYSGTGSC
jgi:hypothetical protein